MQHLNTNILALVAIIALSIGRSAASTSEFKLSRYTGRWYEIARFDNRFERDLECVTADYTLHPDGNIKVINRGYNISKGEWSEAEGRAKTTSEVGLLRVSFFLFFYSDYRILAFDPDYQWALVGSKSPKYLWILARSPSLTPSTIEEIETIIKTHGYDPSKLKFVDHC